MVRVMVMVLVLLCSLVPLQQTSAQWYNFFPSEGDDDDAHKDEVVALEAPVVMESEDDPKVDPEVRPVMETIVEHVLESDPREYDSYRGEYFGPQQPPGGPQPIVNDDSYRVGYLRPLLPPRPQLRQDGSSYRVEYFRPPLPPRPPPPPQPREEEYDPYQATYRQQPPPPQPPYRPPVISPARPQPPVIYPPRPRPLPENTEELRYVSEGGFYDSYAPGELAVPGEIRDTVNFVIGEGGVKCDTSCRGACIIRDRQCKCMQNVTCFEMLKHRLSEPSSPIYVIPPSCPQLMECKHTCSYVVQWPDGWCLCHKDPICLQWQRRVRREKRQAQRAKRKSTRRAARIAKREAQRKAMRAARRAKKRMRNGKSAKKTRHQT